VSFCNAEAFFISRADAIDKSKQAGLFYSVCIAPGFLFPDFFYNRKIGEAGGVNKSLL
jgi:hypothetical protein